jgi:hypothetical protein
MPVPDFSPGEVLTAAAMDSIGLWLVKTQTIGTAVSSVTVTDAFSADYDNYRIIVSGGVASANMAVNLTLGSTATGYYRAGVFVVYNSTTVNGIAQQNQTSFAEAFSGTANQVAGIIDIINPFLAKTTGFQTNVAGVGPTRYALFLAGYLSDTTSYTAFTLTPSTGTMTGGTIRVYGYRN